MKLEQNSLAKEYRETILLQPELLYVILEVVFIGLKVYLPQLCPQIRSPVIRAKAAIWRYDIKS